VSVNLAGLGATVDRQIRSRFRSPAFWIGAVAPVVIIAVLVNQAGDAAKSPAMTMFLAIVSALWIGGSGCVREIVDERRLVQRDPHLSLLAYAAAKLLFASGMALFQSLVLTIAVAATSVVVLPAPYLWVILCLTTLCGAYMALTLSALCDEASTALAWFPLMLVPQVVFGGFLFPYAETRPFALDDYGQVVVTHEKLLREPARNPLLQVAGALTVSRWALEAYAAQVYEQRLSNDDAMEEAVSVNAFVPVTLGENVGGRLLGYHLARSRREAVGTPRLDAGGIFYLVVLTMFAGAQALALVVVLPARDPRRVKP
jgi:hypothetical protein